MVTDSGQPPSGSSRTLAYEETKTFSSWSEQRLWFAPLPQTRALRD